MTDAASVGGGERIRLFIGLPIPEDVVDRLVPWQDDAFGSVRDVRAVTSRNLHITLAFLGHRPAEEVESVARCMREAAEGALVPSLSLRRYRETRSVGMLVFDDEDERATRLAGDLHGRLEQAGVYEREQRPWLPHLTVVRFRQPPRLRPDLPDLGVVSPSEAAVYHSVLRRGGAQYEVLESVRLGGG